MKLTRRALKQIAPAPVPEFSAADQIAALESERALLAPYASTKGLAALKRRVAEIGVALYRLRGLPLDGSRIESRAGAGTAGTAISRPIRDVSRG